jgi:hypothetical protein
MIAARGRNLSRVERSRATLAILVFGGLVAGSFTVLFLGMRAVMEIGGSCGGVGAPRCPGNVGGLMPAAIWGGLIFAGLYIWQCVKHHVPSFTSLLWPALFLSLGYNFFDYAFNGGVVAAGFLICGVVFGLMGAVPLLYAIPHLWNVYRRGEIEADKPWHVKATGNAVGALKTIGKLQTKPVGMAENLERLDELHRSGALTDFEYAQAKDRVIRGQVS